MSAGRLMVTLLVLLTPAVVVAQGLSDAAARERAEREKRAAESEKSGKAAASEPHGRIIPQRDDIETTESASPTGKAEATENPSPTGEAAATMEKTPDPASSAPSDEGGVSEDSERAEEDRTRPAPAPSDQTPAVTHDQAPAVTETRKPTLPVALAVPPAPEPPPPMAPRPTDGPRLRWRGFELGARFLGRAFQDRAEGETESDLGADNVRFEIRWRPRPRLRAVLEWDHDEMIARDFALREVSLKDAFLELRPGRFRIRVGQFKSPLSPVELASRWDLPVSDRGLLSDLLRFSFGVAGRRPGLELRWRKKGGPIAVTMATQRATSTRGDRIGDESFNNVAPDWGALATTARVVWEGKRTGLGGVFNLRTAEPLPDEGYAHLWTAGADVSWRGKGPDRPRVWAEGYVGSSWQDSNAFDGRAATFLAGRVLGAWNVRLQKLRSLYLEPFLGAALIEPDRTVREDLVWEASGGLCLTALGHLRLVLEVQRRGVARNAPPSLGLAPAGGPPMRSRTRLIAQIGAAF